MNENRTCVCVCMCVRNLHSRDLSVSGPLLHQLIKVQEIDGEAEGERDERKLRAFPFNLALYQTPALFLPNDWLQLYYAHKLYKITKDYSCIIWLLKSLHDCTPRATFSLRMSHTKGITHTSLL